MDVFRKILNPSDDMNVCSLYLPSERTEWFVAPGYVSPFPLPLGTVVFVLEHTHTSNKLTFAIVRSHPVLPFPPSSHNRHVIRRSHAVRRRPLTYSLTQLRQVVTLIVSDVQLCDMTLDLLEIWLQSTTCISRSQWSNSCLNKFYQSKIFMLESRCPLRKSNWALCCINQLNTTFDKGDELTWI